MQNLEHQMFQYQQILWLCRSNGYMGFLYISIYFVPFIFITCILLMLYDWHENDLYVIYVCLFFVSIAYLYTGTYHLKLTAMLSYDELILLNTSLFHSSITVPLKDVLKIEVKPDLKDGVRIYFYYNGVDAEGYQNKVVLYCSRDTSDLEQALKLINSKRFNEIPYNQSQ